MALEQTSSASGGFIVDLSADLTVAWLVNCTQTVASTSPAPCSSYPTNLAPIYNPTSSPVTSVNGFKVSGYTVSGYIYSDVICIDNSCRFTDVLGVESISEDNLLFGQTGYAGILGFGVDS